MNKSFTAVVDRNVMISTSPYATEPYEAGWAREARWFVRVLQVEGGPGKLALTPQVSPDGLFWCEDGTPGLVIEKEGLYTFAMKEFGNWLRLSGSLEGDNPGFKVIVYL